ncbi:MAG: GNAT family N-acetyltransferase [Actinomycetota bacterium]
MTERRSPVAAADYRYEPSSPTDLDAIHGLSSAVGWPHRRRDIEAALVIANPWRAVDPTDGRLLGVAMWWPMGEFAARIGLVIVAPESQGLGIGRRLMERVIESIGPRAMMLLATDEGRPLYARLGFETIGLSQRHLGRYRAEPTGPNDAEPLRRRDLAAIVELDAAAMGAARPRIVEHLVDVGDGVVLRAGGGISGYAIRRPFGDGDVVGPIVSSSEGDAGILFRAVARPGLTRVDRPLHAPRFGALLDRSGVGGHEVTHVMVRGAWPHVEPTVRSYAMASHALG